MANAIILPPLPIAAATTYVADGQSSALNVANDFAGVVFSTSGTDLIVDLGADVICDGAILFGCEGVGPDTQMIVYAARSETGYNAAFDYGEKVPALAGSAMPSSGRGVCMWRPSVPFGAARYWLFRFEGLVGRLSIARVVLGRALMLERNYSYGASFGVRDLGSLDFSARGVLLRRRGARLRTAGLTFSAVRKDEVEAQVQPLLERIGNTDMVALITDPAEGAMRQRRCYYGPLVGDLGTTRRSAVAYEAKANIVSIF